MAALLGVLWGNRGTTTRLGTKKSGIAAMLKTWKTRVNCYLSHDDVLKIYTEGEITILVNGKEIKP